MQQGISPSRCVSSGQAALLWVSPRLLPASLCPIATFFFVGQGPVPSHERKAEGIVLPAPWPCSPELKPGFLLSLQSLEHASWEAGGNRHARCPDGGVAPWGRDSLLQPALNNHYPGRLQRQWADVMAGTATAPALVGTRRKPSRFPLASAQLRLQICIGSAAAWKLARPSPARCQRPASARSLLPV